MEATDAVARAERGAHGLAWFRERGELEQVGTGRHVRDVHRLGDEAAPDDADAYAHALTARVTFLNACEISSMSLSSHSGDTSTWIVRSSRSSVRGQSGAGRPSAAIASRTGFQNG